MADSTPAEKVFIVDDDDGLATLIGKALQREGFATARAASGGEAIAWLAENRADLMLLDLKLPDMQGHELVERVRKAGHETPFIIITGQGDERVAVEMMKLGATDYLIKAGGFLELVPEVVRRSIHQVSERRRLEQEILRVSEREQRRIGQDLHDGLGQHLAGIELMIEVLAQQLATETRGGAARAAEIARHVREAIHQTRMLAKGLSPVEPEPDGLMCGLRELAMTTEKLYQVPCAFHCDPPVLIHNNAASTHLYRIAQEAVGNAIKHGRPKQIEIGLTATEGRINLAVRDNGSGFPDTPSHRGMGVRIMRYRAGMLGGSLVVEHRKGGGTTVVCSVHQPIVAPPP